MKIDFSDYICITENNIIDISKSGIKCTYQNQKHFISFEECAMNYSEIHPKSSGKCIGERYSNDNPPKIVFYTAPLTTHIHFLKKSGLKELFSKVHTYQRFYNLQKKILEYQYTTFDMS